MDYFLVCFVALIGAALTLFSGFGLGTLLLPIFGLFFPIEVAIIMTSLVHFSNNFLKVILHREATEIISSPFIHLFIYLYVY